MVKRSLVFGVVAVIAAVLLVLALRSRQRSPLLPSSQQFSTEPAAAWDATATPPALKPAPQPSNLNLNPNPNPNSAAEVPAIPKPGFTINPVENPRGAIDEVLTSETSSDDDKWRRLLDVLQSVPEAFQEEAAQHLCNLIPDAAYGTLGPLLTNGVAPEPVLDIVMTDLLSRPNTLKLPMLLNMARNEQHQRNEEARSVLELYLEKDYGTDWKAWEQSLQAWLKDNPE